jgi:hypothetical protein
MATILFPLLFMIVGALVFAFSPKAAQLGLALFLAGAIVTAEVLSHVALHLP